MSTDPIEPATSTFPTVIHGLRNYQLFTDLQADLKPIENLDNGQKFTLITGHPQRGQYRFILDVPTFSRQSSFFAERLVGKYRGSVLDEEGVQVVKLDRDDAMEWKLVIEALYDPMSVHQWFTLSDFFYISMTSRI